MKKLLTFITSTALCATMLVTGPAQVIASAAETGKTYVSEVKVGMGETSEQASKELLDEGYTILSDGNGNYADLNKDAGSKDLLKSGPNQKIVYMGYKTTTDAAEAITDLAVMNMNGGYSFQDYEMLMDKQMDSQIKPFTDRFIATLKEYRTNLKKSEDSINYIRANYYRNLLNKLTDDDCGGKPLGDLLINQTKYEMGDDAYNALSDEEKKDHCDILTLLMQGKGEAVMLMETELTKASDTGEATWLDRFQKLTLESMTEAISDKDPTLTDSEINATLDKKYYDDAKRILDKWSAFQDILNGYDEAVDKAAEVTESESGGEVKAVTENSPAEEIVEAASDTIKTESDMLKGGRAAEDIVVSDYLDATPYDNGTLMDYFFRDASEFRDDESIRQLYPIVEALSGGQLAGLDFLSIKDMILMAITDESGYKKLDIDGMEPASVYQGVNREIYEKGGVALTNDALRTQANAKDAESTFMLSPLGFVLWGSTAAAGIAAGASAIAKAVIKPDILKNADAMKSSINAAEQKIAALQNELATNRSIWRSDSLIQTSIDIKKELVSFDKSALNRLEASEEFKSAATEFAAKSKVCSYLAWGFAAATAVLAGLSIYTTINELLAYYKVDFAPIPKYIVDEVDITATNDKGEKVMVQNQSAYYRVVLCNRTAGSSDVEKENYEILGDRNDLNGDVGTQWLALYSVKYESGTPILADSFQFRTGKTELPEGYSTGIHRFGERGAFNLTSKYYCYNDPNNGTYVFFKNDPSTVKELTAAGSLFSGGSIAIGAAIGLIVGCGGTLLIAFLVKKRKDEPQA